MNGIKKNPTQLVKHTRTRAKHFSDTFCCVVDVLQQWMRNDILFYFLCGGNIEMKKKILDFNWVFNYNKFETIYKDIKQYYKRIICIYIISQSPLLSTSQWKIRI